MSRRAVGGDAMRSRAAASALAWCAAVVACRTETSSWMLTRAEQERAGGRLESALELTGRELIGSNRIATRRLIDLHAGILRDLQRTAEADAFLDFAKRFEAGGDTYNVERDLSGRDCSNRQRGYPLVREWGRVDEGPWEGETVVATFEIDARGDVRNIHVLSAWDPGSAWLGIDSIGRAKIRKSQLAEFVSESRALPLCFWRDFSPLEDQIPSGGRIRGSR